MNKKIAAIDIGTNSFHLIIVEVLQNGNFEIIDREKEVIRLSSGSKGDIKKITDEAMERGISALQKFAGIAKSYDAKIRAVATSAVRESQNKHEFIEKVEKETGIQIEVISGIEEGRLIYLGVQRAVPVFNKRILCIDIGGGSTEFVIGYKGKILYANSLKLGAFRLTKLFFPDFKVTKEGVEACRKWVEGELNPLTRAFKDFNVEMVVGSSGTILSAGLMIQFQNDKNANVTLLNNLIYNKSELEKLEEKILKASTLESRKKIKGLDEKRADIIPAGIILLKTIFDQLEFNEIKISGYALREGIILDQISKEYQLDHEILKTNIKNHSAEKLANSCNYDLLHCRHVEQLCGEIFDQTTQLHGLDESKKEYLLIAARLHDIGYHIAHSKHHKHSQYIIENSELMGFNEDEIRTIACIARYHRKSHPKLSHYGYSDLPKQWKTIVNKLSAILRVADALDRTHNSLVKNVFVRIENDEVIISVNNELKSIDIELWSLERKKKLFEEIYSKRISVHRVGTN